MAILFQILSTLGFVLFIIPLAAAMFLDGLGDWLGITIIATVAGFVTFALVAGLWGGSAHIADKLTKSRNNIVRLVGYLSTILVSLPIISIVLALIILVGSFILSPFVAIGYVLLEEYPNFLWVLLAVVMVIVVSLFFAKNPTQDETTTHTTSK